MEIPEIGSGIREIKIRSAEIKIAEIRPWEVRSPVVNRIGLDPITQKIGRPIVDIPGCVEARQSDNMELLEDDPKGNLTLCDGGVPYFRPIQFEPEIILQTPKPKADTPKSTSKTTNPINPPMGLTGCATPHCGQIGVLRFSLLPQFRQWVLSDILT